MPYDHQPIFATRRLTGSAWCVRVTWPDGFETKVHGFTTEAQARIWVVHNGPHWHEWAPRRVKASLEQSSA